MNFQPVKNFMDALTKAYIPGNSIVIYKDNQRVFEYASGYADLENEKPMTGEELVNIYSCSKVATITAALQLLEQGKFLLSDPLYAFIPEYRAMQRKTANGELVKVKNPITMRQLFTMTAGFSYDSTTAAFQKAREITKGKMDTLTAIRCLAEDSLLFEPGSHWNYSLCHDVLAAVVEVISGKKFSHYVKENIFDPLEMKDSAYHTSPQIEARMAQQYSFEPDEDAIPEFIALHGENTKRQGRVKIVGKAASHRYGEEYDSGGAGIVTSRKDYGKFAAALANGGLGLNGERILSAGSVELLRTNQLNEEQMRDFTWPQLRGYGYGLGVRTMIDRAKSGSNGSIGEFGWGGAAGSNVLIDPNRRFAAFYVAHMLNPQEGFYQPRLRNVLYTALED